MYLPLFHVFFTSFVLVRITCQVIKTILLLNFSRSSGSPVLPMLTIPHFCCLFLNKGSCLVPCSKIWDCFLEIETSFPVEKLKNKKHKNAKLTWRALRFSRPSTKAYWAHQNTTGPSHTALPSPGKMSPSPSCEHLKRIDILLPLLTKWERLSLHPFPHSHPFCFSPTLHSPWEQRSKQSPGDAQFWESGRLQCLFTKFSRGSPEMVHRDFEGGRDRGPEARALGGYLERACCHAEVIIHSFIQ